MNTSITIRVDESEKEFLSNYAKDRDMTLS